MGNWLIESVGIDGGFLGGLLLNFPPGLTCIIGPRGSGKSTLAEAFRYTMSGLGGASKSRSELVQANLGTAVISIGANVDADTSYRVTRSFRQPATISNISGGQLLDIDIDRGTFLPIDAYSNAEIEAIADESLGERRRALVDDLRADALRQIDLVVAERRRALEANSDAVRAKRQFIIDMTEHIEELGDVRARLASLADIAPDNATSDLLHASRQQQHNKQEQRKVEQSQRLWQECRESARQLQASVQAAVSESLQIEGSENVIVIRNSEASIHNAAREAVRFLEQAEQKLNSTEEVLLQLRILLRTEHAAQDTKVAALQQIHLETSRLVQRRTEAEEEVARLETLERQRAGATKELAELMEQRGTLKAAYLLERERISALREEVASQLQKEMGNTIRIRVMRNADVLRYQQVLTDGLKGARVRNHEDIIKAIMCLRPEQFAQIIQDNDIDEFEHQASLGGERSRKILDSYRESVDPFALEIITIDDQIRVELNVASAAEPRFRDASELSRGQKCTALLPLLLARRDTPLIIDQPEDNLDNHFIFETVVEAIRRLKSRRQMLFITHNANIPVLGEAELVVVMNSDGRRGYVQKAGSLDECRDEIIDLLEGGRDAFERRRKRYG